MSRGGPARSPESALAAVLGGAVTRERLLDAAAREGRGGSPLVRSLAAQSLPGIADLARAYAAAGSALRLDDSFVVLAPKTSRLLDADLLQRERCVPVELFDDLCILAVEEGRAEHAVEAVRAALQRDVLPVMVGAPAIQRALESLVPAPRAVSHGALPRRDAPVHARFRDLILDDARLDAVSLPEDRR
jgi:hypothetical protein